MSGITPRVRVPRTARPGEVVEIRTLISHPMETGHRIDRGTAIPRHIVERFTCHLGEDLVMELTVEGGVAANPYFEFTARVDAAGTFRFAWHDSTGAVYEESADIALG